MTTTRAECPLCSICYDGFSLMHLQPFTILAPFADRLSLALIDKADGVRTDEDLRHIILQGHTSKKGAGFLPASRDQCIGLVSLKQMHGNRAVIVRTPSSRAEQADGLLTDQRGLTLTIRWADCQNFLVYAPENNVVGLMHVGWRGLNAGMIPSFFATLKTEWHVDAQDVLVAAGPSLCMRCADFSDPVHELPNIDARFKDDRHVDLRTAADDQLFRLGVRPDRFARHPDCTRCSPQQWWTYRGGDREAVTNGYTNVLACALV